ncbi:hypothetical protein [Nocardioides speluncae]|uniref:hypothetical protein n=1 Tax=Nocardioides speluncae TaxID=2670337 RepID=UPI000D69B6F0|nr:hypothetical protein [Nocardioides speluncae]
MNLIFEGAGQVSDEYLNLNIGALKRAAIDAWMNSHSNGWWEIDGSHYRITGGDATVTRPGEDGEGGGDWDGNFFLTDWIVDGSKDEEYTSAFADIRTRIDNALKDWDHNLLPKPKNIEEDVEQARQAMRLLSTAASTSGGATTGGGEIAGYLKSLNQNASSMSGQSMEVFKAKFINQLESAISGYRGIALVLGNATAAELKIWTETRATIIDSVTKTTTAFNAAANDDSVNWEVVLKVAGAAVSGAKAFLTGGLSGVLEGAAAGLTLISDMAAISEKEAAKPDSNNYEGIMVAFETSLTDLSKAIKSEEEQIKTNIDTNFGQVQADKSSYDLTAAVVDDGNPETKDKTIFEVTDDSQVSVVVINADLANGIIDVAMPGVAAELAKAADQIFFAGQTKLRRPDGIGLGTNGPSGEIYDLGWRAAELCKDLEWEVVNGAKMLRAIIEDLGVQDSSSSDKLEQLQASLNEGSGWDPWD